MKITRKTGFAGKLAKVKVKIDNQVIAINNNETQQFEAQNKIVTFKASQAYFGSPKIQVEDPKEIEITSNPIASWLLIISFFLAFISILTNALIFSLISFVFVASFIIYSTKNWFKLEIK
ncbi:hypothetical protein [Isobaculum melis]|uniref:Uncharacterized protein n=1 Tax=Isobaculum melis TaxID=142588 RepID=A0A1H9S038_9LACT|nr:hypothetical protein [Isobaculum melis]SER78416.1 hypothetical protein SAMN04488559_1069 [Isobaculum melis]